MRNRIGNRLVVAVEVRKSCIGYAVFGGHRLLDWGTTMPYPLDGATLRAQRRFLSLLKLLPPEVVVLRRPRQPMSRGTILRFLKRMTARHGLQIVVVTQDDVSRVFNRPRNKDGIAETLAGFFPELLFKLPPKRDTGDSERQVMLVFDAVATGYTYLLKAAAPPPE